MKHISEHLENVMDDIYKKDSVGTYSILNSIQTKMILDGLSYRKLCDDLGISRTHLSNQIAGRKEINLSRVEKICEYLGLEITIGFKK